MDPAPKPCALDMQSEAVEAPMTNLVTEPTELPHGTLFIAMVSIVYMALTAVKMGKLHLGAHFSLFGMQMHCHLIERQSL